MRDVTRADEITIGVPDERIVPDITRVLGQRELPSRWGPGKTLSETGPHTLLSAIADYAGRQHFRDFAALLRQPDIGRWLAHRNLRGDWLTELDKYQAEHLPYRLTGRWLGLAAATKHLRPVFQAVQQLVAPLAAAPKPLADWSDSILALLAEVYGWRELDRSLAQDRGTLAACQAMRDAAITQLAVPSALAPTVPAGRAIRWIMEQTAGQLIPPPAEDEAIELLGWLELPLDDAPAVIITSLNEGFVPDSVNSDLFLPNRLRKQLGILDNLRRYARDAYALSVLSAARDECDIIVARRNHEGDPLVPSRLLFAADQHTVAERARTLFATPAAPLTAPATPTGRSELTSNGLPVGSIPVPRPLELAEPIEHMSVTSFRDYIACPYRFYLRHVLRLRALDDHADELDGSAFGSLAHEILRGFGESSDRDSTDAAQIRQVLHHLLSKTVAKQYGRDAMAVTHVQVEQLRMRLDAFAEKQAEWAAAGWRIEFTEVPTNEEQHAELIVDGEAMPLTGRIDRIDINPQTGQRVVFDYKTSDGSRHPRDAHQRRGEWIDLQLPLYRHLVRSLEIEGPVEFGYILLPKDTSRVDYCLAKWTDEELVEADTIAADVVRAVRQARFWPPADPAPDFSGEFAYICQDDVL